MQIDDDDDGITGINVTPLVDISLVLLIIFMVTANLIVNPSVRVDMPKSKTSDPQEDLRMNVTITKDLDYYMAGMKTTPAAIFDQIRQKFLDGGTNLQVLISCDKSVAVENVISFMDGVKKTGVNKIGIQVERPEK
jgi:biopolymer transport protein ExbD